MFTWELVPLFVVHVSDLHTNVHIRASATQAKKVEATVGNIYK